MTLLDSFAGLLRQVAAGESFCGKSGQSVSVRLQGQKVKRVVLAGLGKREGSRLGAGWKGLGGVLAAAASQGKVETAGVVVIGGESLPHSVCVTAAGSIALGEFQFHESSNSMLTWHMQELLTTVNGLHMPVVKAVDFAITQSELSQNF